ncbi:sodium:solute symporter family transporter [uncultured Oscillibacter sp.]|uniref:sodium:solute symporter family transporter n=1 Tax=uncultured Oscillibacter sp. TaxID=876091 RepID=UPI0025D92A30|nr:hypothetical protein [uncultured Oscillibacter sp.]
MIWIGLIGYFIILVLVGIVSERKSKKTFDEFATGSRSMSGWVLGFSEATSIASAFLWLGWIGQGYTDGVVTLWYAVPVVLTTWFIWSYVAPRFRDRAAATGAINLAEVLVNEFDDKKKKLKTAYAALLAIATFYFMFMYAGSQFNAIGTTFVNLTDGAISHNAALLIGAGIVILYTYLGGFKAVVWTDFIQSIAVVGSLIALVFIVVAKCGGIGAYVQAIGEISNNYGGWKGTFSSSGIVLYILAWISSALCFLGAPHAAVRWLATASKKDCYQAGLIATFFQGIRMVLPIMIGMGARVLFGDTIESSQDTIFVVLNNLTSPLFTGIVLAGILAATMSTADSQFLEAVNTFCVNIYKNLIKKGDVEEQKLFKLSKLMVIVVAVLAVLGALLRPDTIFGGVQYAYIGLGSMFGPTLVMMLFFRKQMTLEGCFAGGLIGSIGFVIFSNMISAGVFPEAFVGFVSSRESLVIFPLIVVVTIVCNVVFKEKDDTLAK